MCAISLRKLLMLALAAGMVAVSVAGLVGTVSDGPVLAAGLFTVAVVLAFDLGRTSTDLW